MQVHIVKPFGYCQGVKQAINLAIQTRKDNPNVPVYTYGNLVHNAYVRDVLSSHMIQTLDRHIDFSTLKLGYMLTTAHGISEEIIRKIKAHGFTHIDATCPLVYKSFNAIKEAISEQKIVLYFGNKKHPEAIAALSIDPHKVFIFERLDDLKNLDYQKEYVLTNQTTIRHEELEKYYLYLLNLKYKVDLVDEVCNATKIRQSTLSEALQNDFYDVVFVVGDPSSNNSRQLYQIARDLNDNSHFITSYLDIQPEWIKNADKALISSGASTPNILVDQIAHFLKGNDMTKFEIENRII